MKYSSRMLAGWLGGMLTVIGLSGGGAAQAVTQNTALMQAIAREIAHSDELAGIDWVEVTAVFGVDGDGDVNESYGYAYDRAGQPHAVAFLEDPIEREVQRYREWLRPQADKGFIKMLFQFNRDTRRANADFEYDDPRRWQVTPANIDTITETLRPSLGD
ncbi:hypothetical protein [Achromobacter deleyi]|uniref:hypothetical protein n=1 Tax=Achromobacter deleyi TaxID=1353891 RepID=UPI0014697442|nr:hypothetical protein [Achromobacter deleyi]CAB3861366.1 hypothetical protein LMG3412_02279 [Achromobacter deleyi]